MSKGNQTRMLIDGSTLTAVNKSNNESGIYQIRNLVNGKVYIGSSLNIYRRCRDHKCALRGQYHFNEHLQRSWNKYGEEGFIFEVLQLIEDEVDLLDTEQYYLDETNPDYNIAKFADAPTKGRKFSEKAKRNMKAVWTQEKRKAKSEQMQGKRNHNYRKPMSENQKKKISVSHRELPLSEYSKIQELYATGDYIQQELADMWSVSVPTISNVVRTDIGQGVPVYVNKHNRKRKILPSEYPEIVALYDTGELTQEEIGKMWNVTKSIINKIVNLNCEEI